MLYIVVKLVVTAALVVLISEVARRSTLWGGLLASLPLVSLLAMVWLYVDTGDSGRVAALARSILWLILPSLPFFVVFPVLLKRNVSFYLALGISLAVLVVCYAIMLKLAARIGVTL